MRNAPIPPVGFPQELREGSLFRVAFHQLIAELEKLASGDSTIQINWPADAIALTNYMIDRGDVALYEGMGLQQAWHVLSAAHVRGVVDAFRNRVRDLALALEQLAPDAGEPSATPPSPAAVQNIVHNNIYGGATSLAINSSHVDQTAVQSIAQGDRDALLDALRAVGVSDADLSDLESAIAEDQHDDTAAENVPGPRVRAWLGNMVLRGGSVGGKVATGAAGGVVAAIVKSYFGL